MPPRFGPMIRTLVPADYRVMPWKNGGGTTTEIHIHPAGAGWDDFLWRVGIADIGRSGPFSSFHGIDRSIMLLECPEGSGMRLTIDGRDIELPLRRFVDFAGEATTSGTLTGAPVRDFNVMSRRGRVGHRCRFEPLAAGASLATPAARWGFAFVVAGDARVHGLSSAATMPLARGTSALIEDEAVQFVAGDEGCAMVLASFDVPAGASAASPHPLGTAGGNR